MRLIAVPRITARLLLGFAGAAGIVALVMPTPAHACSVKSEQHCYAIEDWEMTGSPAEVMGAYASVDIYYGQVPNWSPEGEGGFLDNEVWVAFPGFSSSGAWVEAGATVGWPYSGTEPRYFVARQYNSKDYWEYVWPTAGPGYNNWFSYYINEPHGKNGEWCLTWAWDKTPSNCFTSFPKSSKELNGGLEFATTTTSGANNNGLLVGWQQWTNGAWYENWESAWNHPFAARNKPLCLNVPAPGRHWGSVAFSVPGC
ncbi:MAG: hypothetical protein H0X28_09090 [Solirubrobacterales bacterium]|nr:hypothetical protein [Solirubrobacterales bacterium]